MADTKVSGLTAAASFLTTHEIPVNEAGTSKKVTGAQVLAVVAQGTAGSAYYAQVVATQGTYTAATDLTSLTVTITAPAGRRFLITATAPFSSSVATDAAQLNIQEGATVLGVATLNNVGATGTVSSTCVSMAVITPTAGAHTYKLVSQRTAGTGNITMAASALAIAFILIEDIGT
jgi:hypothetical protein